MRSSPAGAGRSRIDPVRRTRTVAVPFTAVLFLVALATVGMQSRNTISGHAAPAAHVAEVSGRIDAGAGRSLQVTLLVDTQVADPELALQQEAPGAVSSSDGATAAFVKWKLWPVSAIPLRLRYNPADELEGVDGLEAVTEAVEKWSAVTEQRMRLQIDGTTDATPPRCTSAADPDGTMVVGWRSDLAPGTLASTCALVDDDTGALLEMDVAFSSNIKWSTADTTPADMFDFKSTMLHEMGHVVGLDHTSTADAVMLAQLGKGQQRRTLGDDDIAGVRSLYPAPTSPTATPTEPRPHLPITVNVIAVSRD